MAPARSSRAAFEYESRLHGANLVLSIDYARFPLGASFNIPVTTVLSNNRARRPK
jgi:hypothetical protein